MRLWESKLSYASLKASICIFLESGYTWQASSLFSYSFGTCQNGEGIERQFNLKKQIGSGTIGVALKLMHFNADTLASPLFQKTPLKFILFVVLASAIEACSLYFVNNYWGIEFLFCTLSNPVMNIIIVYP